MKDLMPCIILFFVVVAATSCSVISPQIRSEAIAERPLTELIGNVDQYKGQTVILGGYVLETRVAKDITRLFLIQAPLWFSKAPKGKDQSEGRLVVLHKGFLDPEIYSKGRMVTVAGTVVGIEEKEATQCPVACLVIESREIYIWPEYEYRNRYYYDPYYYDPYFPYYYRRYPYQPHPYYW